uniref:Homeobox domain-containing protein n=1 Tax=Echinostoma caproni TaxID=27848 RepID=A0A183ASS9_9TREM
LLPKRATKNTSKPGDFDYEEPPLNPVQPPEKNKLPHREQQNPQRSRVTHTSSPDSFKTEMSSFYAQMEQELAGQPANVGRLSQLGSHDPTMYRLWKRNKQGLSGRKKPRKNGRHARLAEAEDFESDDSDENLELGNDYEQQPSTNHTAVACDEMANHVMRNLCASAFPSGSELQPPTGPAAQLFAALGIPVNQLGSVRQGNHGAP